MRIRDNQRRQLLQTAETNIFPAVKEHLLQVQPGLAESVPPEELDRRIRNGIARAVDYGITLVAGVASFVGLMFEIAPNFDEQPGIALALADPFFDANQRIMHLPLHTTDEDWQHAVLSYDAAAWDRRTKPPVSGD
jgi:hypothetical protein